MCNVYCVTLKGVCMYFTIYEQGRCYDLAVWGPRIILVKLKILHVVKLGGFGGMLPREIFF